MEKLLEYAKREVDPSCASRFEPIARGPVFAIVCLAALGVVALLYLVPALLCRAFRRVSG